MDSFTPTSTASIRTRTRPVWYCMGPWNYFRIWPGNSSLSAAFAAHFAGPLSWKPRSIRSVTRFSRRLATATLEAGADQHDPPQTLERFHSHHHGDIHGGGALHHRTGHRHGTRA